MNNKVIYTCSTGGYDALLQPLVYDPSFDYICFTDSKHNNQEKIGVWEIREIPVNISDIQRLSRYPKMHPHILLKEYEYTVYIDANILIQTEEFYQAIEQSILGGFILSGIKHPKINCIYDEFFNVIKYRKESNLNNLKKQYKFLVKQKFPKNVGMYEANIIFRKTNNLKVQKQCEDWWEIFLTYTRRDQLSYSYTLWKNNVEFNFLMNTCGIRSTSDAPYKIIVHKRKPHIAWNILTVLIKVFGENNVRRFFYFYLNH